MSLLQPIASLFKAAFLLNLPGIMPLLEDKGKGSKSKKGVAFDSFAPAFTLAEHNGC